MELSIPVPVPELAKVIPAHPCWINKTGSDNHKMIISIAPTERITMIIFVNHNDNGINKTESDNHKIIIVIAPTER